MRQAIQTGLIAFAALTYLLLVGMPDRIGELAGPVLAVVIALFFYLLLRRPTVGAAATTVLSIGGVAGLVAGILIALEVAFFASLLGNDIKVQPVFDKIVPTNLADFLNVRAGTVAQAEISLVAYLMLITLMVGAGLLGAALVLIFRSDGAKSARQFQIPGGRWLVIVLPLLLFAVVYVVGMPGVRIFGSVQGTVRLLIAMMAIGSGLFALRATRGGLERIVVSVLLLLLMLALPLTLDRFQNSVMGIVFIFVMMGLGLNIVVGFAGLLDLGYVAFFAIGAYVYAFVAAPASSPYISALLTSIGISPASPLLTYWLAIPLAMITAAIGGVLLGIPVLRLRGDYLAIVTLGFGEIIRLFMLNLSDLTNGPRGLLNLAQPRLMTLNLGNPQGIFYLALFGSALIAFVAYRLNDSRLGRAWVAIARG